MTKKKIKETEDKVLEKLLGGEDALAQYHKLVEDLWDQAFKGKININTLRAKQEFEDKVLEAISNPTQDTITEIKPNQAGDFSPVEIKSTVTEDGIQIDTKVIEEEEETSNLEAWEHVPTYAEEHPHADKLKEKACEDISKRFDENVNKIFENGKKRLDEYRKSKAEKEEGKKAFEKMGERYGDTVSSIAEAALERIRNNEIKVVTEELKKGNLPNFEEAMYSAMEDTSERTKEENKKRLEEIKGVLAEDFKKIKEERIFADAKLRGGKVDDKRIPTHEEFIKAWEERKAAGEKAIEKPEFPKFKDWRDAGIEGSEEHTSLMKEGKRLARLVYRDKQKLNEGKMLKYIITAVSVHCLAFCFWVGTLFFDIGQAREVIIYLLMAVYTFFYVMLSVKAYESIKIQRKQEEVDRKYEGY
jgi:hypothetical protein